MNTSYLDFFPMFFRFAAAVAPVVAVALLGTGLESRSLALRRAVSYQRYQLKALLEKQARSGCEKLRRSARSRSVDQPLEQAG